MDDSPEQGDLLEPRPGPATATAVEETRQQYASLHQLLLVTMSALVLVTLGIDLFMGKQVRMIGRQLEEQRPLVQKATSDYQKFNEPLIRHFTGALQSFALAHRDFQPVLEKYRPQLKQYYTTPGPSTRPAGK